MMKDGYYWVKVNHNSDWSIKKVKKNKVDLSIIGVKYAASALYEIGDYIETPDKYKDGK